MNSTESSDNGTIPDRELKIILIGAPKVGKTAIIQKYVHNTFVEEYIPTEMQYNASKDVVMESNSGITLKVKLDCYDMSGEDTYKQIRRRFIEDSDGCVFVYAVDDPRSFMLSNNWIVEFRGVCKDVPIIICANKVDMNDRLVTTNSGEMLEYWFQSQYIETSALTGENINNLFSKLVSKILENSH